MKQNEDLTGKRVKIRDEWEKEITGTVIGPDRRTTAPDCWAIVPDVDAYGSYCRSRDEIEVITP